MAKGNITSKIILKNQQNIVSHAVIFKKKRIIGKNHEYLSQNMFSHHSHASIWKQSTFFSLLSTGL